MIGGSMGCLILSRLVDAVADLDSDTEWELVCAASECARVSRASILAAEIALENVGLGTWLRSRSCRAMPLWTLNQRPGLQRLSRVEVGWTRSALLTTATVAYLIGVDPARNAGLIPGGMYGIARTLSQVLNVGDMVDVDRSFTKPALCCVNCSVGGGPQLSCVVSEAFEQSDPLRRGGGSDNGN